MSNGFTSVTDEKLWEAFVRESNEKAFEILYKRYYSQLVRFSWRYSKSKAVAEELVQDFFTDIWENAEILNITYSVKAYFFKAIRNSSLNYIKNQKVQEKYDPEWMSMKKETVMLEIEDKFQEKKYPNLGSLYATKNLYYDLSKISFNLFLLYCFYIICTKLIFLFLNDKYLLSFRKFIVKLYLSYFKIDQNKFSLSERTINCLVNKGSKNSEHAFKLIDKLEKKIKGKVKLENKIFRNIR